MKAFLAAAVLGSLLAPAVIPQGEAPKGKAGKPADAPDEFLLDVANARAKSGRVPNGYGSLGLTQDQKERIYGIRAVYAQRINALEAEIEQLKKEEAIQLKGVLSPIQRDQIDRYEMARRKTVE